MAHFAQIDENNIVQQVIVVNNNELLDENGYEKESKVYNFVNLYLADSGYKQVITLVSEKTLPV